MKRQILIIWSVVLIYVGFIHINYLIESNNNRIVYTNIRTSVSNSISLEEASTEVEVKEKEINEMFKELLNINDEIIGWINVPNTKIDYPVVKTNNNDFYLKHNIHKELSKKGSIFMDFRNEGLGEEKHTILYGHNTKDGSMFGEAKKYKSEAFLIENPIIQFNTLYEEIMWEIFSVYITSVDFYYIETHFPTLNDYEFFLEDIKSRSMFDIEVNVSLSDSVLTLSTCTYEFENARFVIHARRLN